MASVTFHPAGPDRAPAFLVLPGGGYERHADHEAEPVARWLNGLGLHAAVVRYRVGPGCFPQALYDVRDALAALREGTTGLPADRTRIGVIGFSAGGHLAALLATDTDDVSIAERWTYAGRPDAAILGYPVTDLRESFGGRVPNPDAERAAAVMGDVSAEVLAELSPTTRIVSPEEGDTPPIFVWTTSDDDSVHALHTLELMRSLSVAGVPYEGHVFRSGDHGLGLAADDPVVGQWTELAERWLEDLGWLSDS